MQKKFLIKYYHMIRLFFIFSGWNRAKYIKKHHILGRMGENCYWHPRSLPSEPKLVFLGNNVTIAKGVELVTHDVINAVFANDPCLFPGQKKDFLLSDKPIHIGNNVMLGVNVIVLPGVTIGNRVIARGGCVISKDVVDGSIVGGNPARVIGYYDDLAKRRAL